MFGTALIYRQTGTTQLKNLQELRITQLNVANILVWLGFWRVGLSLLWKLAAAPLHRWAIDTYQGSQNDITLLISTLPKLAV